MVCLAARIYKNRAREENLLLALSTSEGRQRTASAAGGARELIPPQVVLSTKSLGGCIIMLSAAGDSRLLIPNKGVSRP